MYSKRTQSVWELFGCNADNLQRASIGLTTVYMTRSPRKDRRADDFDRA